jgi:large subunit ribosomal protein L9
LDGLQLVFPVKAGETGKLYGSVTTAMLAEAIEAQKGIKLERSQIDSQPIKVIGVHTVRVRLTVDLIPEITVVVHHEDQPPESAMERAPVEVEEVEAVGTFADLQAELEAEAVEQARAEREAAGREAVEAEAAGSSATGEGDAPRAGHARPASAESGQGREPAPESE